MHPSRIVSGWTPVLVLAALVLPLSPGRVVAQESDERGGPQRLTWEHQVRSKAEQMLVSLEREPGDTTLIEGFEFDRRDYPSLNDFVVDPRPGAESVSPRTNLGDRRQVLVRADAADPAPRLAIGVKVAQALSLDVRWDVAASFTSPVASIMGPEGDTSLGVGEIMFRTQSVVGPIDGERTTYLALVAFIRRNVAVYVTMPDAPIAGVDPLVLARAIDARLKTRPTTLKPLAESASAPRIDTFTLDASMLSKGPDARVDGTVVVSDPGERPFTFDVSGNPGHVRNRRGGRFTYIPDQGENGPHDLMCVAVNSLNIVSAAHTRLNVR